MGLNNKKSWSLKIVLDTVHVIKQLPTGKFKLLISIDFYFFYIFIWDLDFPLPSKIKQLILVSNAETFTIAIETAFHAV